MGSLFVGLLDPTLTGLLGPGAVTLTRFGTRPHLTAAPMPPVSPPPPSVNDAPMAEGGGSD